VQKLSGDAAAARVRQGLVKMQAPETLTENPQTKPHTLYLMLPKHSFATKQLRKSRETENRASLTRRPLHAGKDPNGVSWENLLRR